MTHDEVRAYQRRHPGRDAYTTQPGDTWADIAMRHGLSEMDVRALNGAAKAPQRLKPGQVVALPAGSLRHQYANGYRFGIDSVDRTHDAKGDLYLAAAQGRSRTSQRLAGGADRRGSDDGGHFIAARFGGPSGNFKHFAQDTNFNRGTYRKIEVGWAKDLRAGRHVLADIHAYYEGSFKRPSSLKVRWTVNGSSRSRFYHNEPGGSKNGRK